MRNTCDRKALEPQNQQQSPLHSGEEDECIPQFLHLSDGDEDTSENESGKHKGGSLFLSWSLSWDRGHRGPCCPTVGERKAGIFTGEGRVGGGALCMAVG